MSGEVSTRTRGRPALGHAFHEKRAPTPAGCGGSRDRRRPNLPPSRGTPARRAAAEDGEAEPVHAAFMRPAVRWGQGRDGASARSERGQKKSVAGSETARMRIVRGKPICQ